MTTLSPPVSPSPRENRPRLGTGASYMSSRSRRSSHSTSKPDLIESPKDKKRLNTKADPSVALKEAQPAAVALEESSLDDIRRLQHRDLDGNLITDPDRSNPTRYRLERPLDTIRAFNAAADGTSNRRSSYQARPSPGFGYSNQDNRRTSYYGNSQFSPPQRPRPGTGGYYRNSSYGLRPDSFAEEIGQQQPPYGRPPRPQGQPYHSGVESMSSPGHSYQQSYETMTSGSDDYNKSTNPSSQNSSFDRLHQMQIRKQEDYGHYDEIQPVQPLQPVQPPMNGYGQNNYGQNGHGQYPAYGGQNNNYNPQMQRNGPPPPPPSNLRQPIKLTTTNSGPPPTRADLNKELPQKRQSWFKRKLSRRDS